MEKDVRKPLYPIGVVAELIGIHPRTLRSYEQQGLINPSRRSGKRFYSDNEVQWLKCLRKLLSDEGLNVAGVKKLLSVAPCWSIRNCPEEKRKKLPGGPRYSPALLGNKRPPLHQARLLRRVRGVYGQNESGNEDGRFGRPGQNREPSNPSSRPPMSYIFGPVPSRRLGRSLGIDVIPPKTCSFDCIYCESGPTTRLSVRREDFADPSEVLAELSAFLRLHPNATDVLTFSSAGEPTLYLGLGELIAADQKSLPPVSFDSAHKRISFVGPGGKALTFESRPGCSIPGCCHRLCFPQHQQASSISGTRTDNRGNPCISGGI